jgi:hypothetical protein
VQTEADLRMKTLGIILFSSGLAAGSFFGFELIIKNYFAHFHYAAFSHPDKVPIWSLLAAISLLAASAIVLVVEKKERGFTDKSH